MKNTIVSFFLFVSLVSCNGTSQYGNPEVDPLKIQENFMDWWTYQYNNVMLSRDFIGLDANAKEITKEQFLQTLSNGGFIPIRLEAKDSTVYYYKLFKIETSSDTSIQAAIAEAAFTNLQNFKKEGQPFPLLHSKI